MLAAHRIAKLPDTQTLMGEVFRDTAFPHQPTRQTLSDTIRLLALTGNVSADQGRWLADNKSHPNRLWSAIGYLSTQAANDATGAIVRSINASLAELTPIKDIARFVSAWAKELPEAIDPQLVYELRNLIRQNREPTKNHHANWDAFNNALEATANNIVTELNNRMEPNLTVMGGQDFDLTLRFGHMIQESGALAVGADHSMGIELGFDVDGLAKEYWLALKMAIVLISRHLFPIMNTTDLLEMNGLLLEEVEGELSDIYTYLAHFDLEATEENIEKALIDLANCCYIDEFSTYKHFSAEVAQRDEIESNWKVEGETTITGFVALTDKLPTPNTEEESRLVAWLTDITAALTGMDELDTWWEPLIEEHSDDSCGNLHIISEYTPVYLEDEHIAAEAASERHDYHMQGGDEDGPVQFRWDTDPRKLLNFADRLNVGYTLLGKLLDAGYK